MMEIAKLIESEIGDFFAGFGHPGEPETPEEMQSQLLARVMPLLAGLEQEPVAYYFPGGEREIEQVSLPDDLDDEQKANCIPLYAAPQLPQPAAVDVMEPTIEAIKRILPTSNPDEYAACIGADMWNACRAAMLHGAEPVIQPYTLPTKCWCHTCRPVTMNDARFVVCPDCGNKRCPHANDHRNACTGSNEPGQKGSAYPAAPQQEVKP